MPQTFRIAPDVFALFPEVAVGVIVCEGVNNREANPAALDALAETVASLPARVTGDIATHPAVAPWREAYRTFGTKASKYPSSIENLIRRILKGYTPAHINTLVDIYNAISLQYLIPVGGEDLDSTEGDIWLAVAGDDEPAVHLLGEEEARAPQAGEVIYKDSKGALCRRWNWKEAERTKLTHATTRAVLVTECVPPIAASHLQAALSDLEARVRHFTGARTHSAVLTRDLPQFTLSVPR
jgi:DNA/RNA-binding domain of Phe-tRNA-synthetase-like protein